MAEDAGADAAMEQEEYPHGMGADAAGMHDLPTDDSEEEAGDDFITDVPTETDTDIIYDWDQEGELVVLVKNVEGEMKASAHIHMYIRRFIHTSTHVF